MHVLEYVCNYVPMCVVHYYYTDDVLSTELYIELEL